MAQGKASMTIETSTAATSVEAFLGGKLDPASVGGRHPRPGRPQRPRPGGGRGPGINEAGKLGGGGGAWYITNTTKPEVQAAAWDFMKFFNSLDSQVTWNTQASYLPYLNAAVQDPRVKTDWTTTLSGRWLAIAYGELTNGVDPEFPGPLMGPYEQFRAAIRDSIDAMVFNGTAPGRGHHHGGRRPPPPRSISTTARTSETEDHHGPEESPMTRSPVPAPVAHRPALARPRRWRASSWRPRAAAGAAARAPPTPPPPCPTARCTPSTT